MPEAKEKGMSEHVTKSVSKYVRMGFLAAVIALWASPAVAVFVNDPITVEIQDGRLLSASPSGIVGYADSELGTPGDFAFK